jgi:ABC-type transport system involved in multi-copper enzyme maturation permease subunit
MARGLGLGPVFAYEWLTRSRRWQSYALRALFVAALLISLGVVWQSSRSSTNLTARQQLVEAGQSFFFTMTIIQLSLVLLAAPASTAGAICLDKARGTLSHVMVTDLSDREIVLGKLSARLVPVLNLVACALPVAALGTLMGGIDPVALTAMLLISMGLAFLGCALALTLSVWLSKAHEVMVVVFATWTLWLLALPIWAVNRPATAAPDWLRFSNPFWLSLAPYNVPGTTSMVEPVVFLLACLGLSAGMTALSVWKVRPVYLQQANRVPRAIKAWRLAAWFRHQVRWWPGPSLDSNPVLWREWHRSRPSKAVRIVWGLYIALTSGFSLKIIWDSLMNPTMGVGLEAAALLNAFQATIGLLLLAASAGTVLSEERVRGSLDVLLSTPLTTRSIVWGKWWGAFRRAPWLAFWPTMVAFSLLGRDTPAWMTSVAYLVPMLIIAQGAALAGLGLALATWISRTGRAVTWTVSALVATVVGFPIAGILLFGPGGGGGRDLQFGIVMGSPFYNSAMPTVMLESRRMMRGSMGVDMENAILAGSIFWAIAYALIALALYLATLRTFDRCLGRTPERPIPSRRRRGPGPVRWRGQAGKSSKAWVGELD